MNKNISYMLSNSKILPYCFCKFFEILEEMCTLPHSFYFRQQGKTLHILGLYYLLKILHKDCYTLA